MPTSVEKSTSRRWPSRTHLPTTLAIVAGISMGPGALMARPAEAVTSWSFELPRCMNCTDLGRSCGLTDHIARNCTEPRKDTRECHGCGQGTSCIPSVPVRSLLIHLLQLATPKPVVPTSHAPLATTAARKVIARASVPMNVWSPAESNYTNSPYLDER